MQSLSQIYSLVIVSITCTNLTLFCNVNLKLINELLFNVTEKVSPMEVKRVWCNIEAATPPLTKPSFANVPVMESVIESK